MVRLARQLPYAHAMKILLGGEPVYACTVLAVEAVGTPITTVEGLGTPDAMSLSTFLGPAL